VDGYLHVFGRAVDIDVIDGHTISPTLIEDTLCRLPDIRSAAVVVDWDRARRVAVIIPWPGKAIDQVVYLRAVAAEYGQAVATSLLLVPRDTIPLTSQGKPDREAIRALGRAGGTSSQSGRPRRLARGG
jgi:fatty-acyl-CoA synthase